MEPREIAHFDVLGRLGSGGMGVVYRARDRVLGRDVALKLVLPEHAGDSAARQRFLREARAAAVLTHPGIATVYEAGEAAADEAGGPAPLYIAEELVEGETRTREPTWHGPNGPATRLVPTRCGSPVGTRRSATTTGRQPSPRTPSPPAPTTPTSS